MTKDKGMTIPLKRFINPERKTAKSRFNLRGNFAIFSVMIIIVLTAILSYLIYWNQKEALTSYSVTTVEAVTRDLNENMYSHFIADILQTNDEFSPEHRRHLDAIAEEYLFGFGNVFKVKIFNAKGKTIYSTDHINVGIVSTSPHLLTALDGERAYKLTEKMRPVLEDEGEKGQKYKIDILEVYVPVYLEMNNPDSTEIIGVFEIYAKRDPPV